MKSFLFIGVHLLLSYFCNYFDSNFSYGPCQTPTLGFCVQRHLDITTFKPEKFWALHPYIIHQGYELKLQWERHRLFDSDVGSFSLNSP